MGYRIIIADDEPKILQLIRMLGKWEEMDIEVVDECHDGQAALESILEHHPDFVLSDIKMPDMDGLELIRETRRQGEESLFILISGYRHFEYARSAIELNVVDYLLKPIDCEQLNSTLKKACRQVDERRQMRDNREEFLRLQRQITLSSLSSFWEDFTYKVNEETFRANTRSEDICNAAYHTAFAPGSYQVLTMCTSNSGLFRQGGSLFQDHIENLSARCFTDCLQCYHHVTHLGCILVLNYRPESRNRIRESISAFHYGIRDMNEIYGDVQFNIGLSRVKENISELKDAQLESVAAEWGRLITTQSALLEYQQIEDLRRVRPEEIITEEEMEQVCRCVKYLRREELAEHFRILTDRAVQFGRCHPGDMSDTYFRLIDRIAAQVPEENREQLLGNFYFSYMDSSRFSQLIRNIYLELDRYLQEEQKKMQTRTARPITEAVHYIGTHYPEQISLDEVAANSNVSAAYLSRLFREEMNVGFNEYLTKIRLEESEKLLADTNMSVREIAAAVGYPDEKYYSRLFKKNTGIRPTEYRRLYG